MEEKMEKAIHRGGEGEKMDYGQEQHIVDR